MRLLGTILLFSALCGAQTVYHARTDLNPIKLPPKKLTWPHANSVVVDPNFGSKIVRITDSRTYNNRSLETADSGTPNVWNKDSTMLVVRDTNAESLIISFDPVTLKAQLRTNWRYFFNTMQVSFSRVDPQILFILTAAQPNGPRTVLQKVDFRQQNVSNVYDFANCLPPSYIPNWSGTLAVSHDDSTFTVAFSDKGQNLGFYAGSYTVGQGCRLLNTKTGEVTGDWGPMGKVPISDSFGLHSMTVSPQGDMAIISSGKCWNVCTGPYFWNIPTLDVKVGSDRGHSAKGYTHLITAEAKGQWRSQLYAHPSNNRLVIPEGMLTPGFAGDKHASWNNVDSDDLNPFFSTNSYRWPPAAAWEDEVIGVDPTSGLVYRFCSTYNSGRSRYFIGKYAVGVVSQDGKFLAFTSDALKTLGLDRAGHSRVDVFVVPLE